VIIAPPPAPIGFDTLLSRSWALFKTNWIVALPPVIAGVVSVLAIGVWTVVLTLAVIAASVRAHAPAAERLIVPLAASGVVLIVLVVVLVLWSYAAMYGMADAAWARGTATFADGFAAFRTRAGALIVAMIGMIGLALAAVILALPTLLLSILALPLATMYVLPSVVSGGRGGFEAIGESFRLVRRFFGQSIVAFLVLIAILYGISLVGTVFILPLEFSVMPQGSELPHAPPLGLALVCGVGYLLSIVASTAYTGFYALAIVGLYRDLAPRAAAAPLPPAPAGIVPTG
jgi:hypothetical protein